MNLDRTDCPCPTVRSFLENADIYMPGLYWATCIPEVSALDDKLESVEERAKTLVRLAVDQFGIPDDHPAIWLQKIQAIPYEDEQRDTEWMVQDLIDMQSLSAAIWDGNEDLRIAYNHKAADIGKFAAMVFWQTEPMAAVRAMGELLDGPR